MDPKTLQKKIIMEKPAGIQRNIQKFIFWCQNIDKNTSNKKSVSISPYNDAKKTADILKK